MAGLRTSVYLATKAELWRLNQQGLLGLNIAHDAFLPGGPPGGWDGIPHGQASVLMGRLLEERWRGMERFPKAGETWTVHNGFVLPVEAVEQAS